jgi:PAS domain S-box-containing protein
MLSALSRPGYFVPLKILGLALLYFLLGCLALLLSIPPGYAMAIYPPAGLALGALLVGGYRYGVGVLIGSFALNLWIGYQTNGTFSQTGVLLALSIALGACLQAGLGCWLVLRRVGLPLTLETNPKIFLFIVLGAVVACIVNASISIFALFSFQILPGELILGNWLTWWAGDALGVMIVAPLCLIVSAEPANLWRSRRKNVMLPLLLTLAVVVAVFLYVRQWEQTRFQREFRETAQRIANALQIRLDAHVEVQKSVVSLFSSVERVNQREFTDFLSPSISSYISLQAVKWAPRVLHAQRDAFERKIRLEHPQFTITERHGDDFVVAAQRDEYYPILYIAPTLSNEKVLGFDLASETVRQTTLMEARDLGLPVASEPVYLLQGEQKEAASLLISAIYAKNQISNTQQSRRQAMLGVVLSALRTGDVMARLLTSEDKHNILFRLVDSNARSDVLPWYDSFTAANKPIPANPMFSAHIHFGGRDLSLIANPAEGYFSSHKSWGAWASMVGGMLFAGLVSMYLLYVSGRSHHIQSLVEQRTQQLSDSEHRLNAILENAAEGIMTFDNNGSVTLCNRAALVLLGYGDEQRGHFDSSLGGHHFSDLFRDCKLNQAVQLDTLLQQPGESDHVFKEVLVRHPDGRELALGMALAKVQNSKQMLFIVILHDLTEKKRMERLKGEFVSAVSHELRTPLTSIRGSLGLLVGGVGGAIPDSAKKLIKLANDNAERLSILINDILDFERLEYGGMPFVMEDHHAIALVKKAIEINQGYAQKFLIELTLLDDTVDVWVRVDESRLIQALSNLISNAIKFSHPNGQVEISITRCDGEMRIWVIDYGIGIAESFRSRVFERFSQSDGSQQRKYGGTGLGLSLAKSMVEKMDGRMGFDSVEGDGSRFYIALPIIIPRQKESET